MPDQRSVTDQLRDLIIHANRQGMYDAADVLQGLLRPEFRVNSAEIILAVLGPATPPSDDTQTG